MPRCIIYVPSSVIYMFNLTMAPTLSTSLNRRRSVAVAVAVAVAVTVVVIRIAL